MEFRECPQCYEQFKPHDRRQKYCSIACRTRFLNEKHRTATGPVKRRGPRKSYAKEKKCLQCGGALSGQRRRFCSELCGGNYWNQSRNKGAHETYHFLTEIDEEALTAQCSFCGPVEIRHAGTKRLKDGRPPYMCLNKRKTSSHRRKSQEHSWRRRGIDLTYEAFEAMLAEQGSVCAICRQDTERTMHVDHCHRTGRVRGLLCDNCNTGLGKFGDDPDRLEAAAAYLRAVVD